MIGIPKTGTLEHCTISANVSTGFQVKTADGRPASLAIVDADGNVIEAGEAVAREAWAVCIAVQKNFWIGQGHLVVHSSPPGLGRDPAKPLKG
jgi:hypothetical protein